MFALWGIIITITIINLPNLQLRRHPHRYSILYEQKQKYPTSIILTRAGEFYEEIGLDAILLKQFCGLNPMGGKVRL